MTDQSISCQFRRFDHVERLGHPEVRDIDVGTVFVFSKLDGTNASVWLDDLGAIQCGSRNRVLSADADNHGFYAWVHSDDLKASALRDYCRANKGDILYGEWLVPHSLRTYREDAWRRFYVFDVYARVIGRYARWHEYGEDLQSQGLDVIEPLCTIDNPSASQLQTISDQNTYLIQDGLGVGEGIVIKNYGWQNHFGRQPWAKMVRAEFKEANSKIFGIKHVDGKKQVEAEIIAELATEAFIRKTFAKVVGLVAKDKGMVVRIDTQTGVQEKEYIDLSSPEGPSPIREGEFIQVNRHKIIPRLLGTVFHEFVQEEIWTMLKKHKNAVIDFGKLHKLLTLRVKAVLTEVF